eukprot:15452427-Alexandrium_andersonii.AAC.1
MCIRDSLSARPELVQIAQNLQSVQIVRSAQPAAVGAAIFQRRNGTQRESVCRMGPERVPGSEFEQSWACCYRDYAPAQPAR